MFRRASAAPILLLTLISSGELLAQRADPLAGLDAYVAQGMHAWKIPGLAIAVVRNDSVILARGYGVRTIGTNDRVDENSLFAIASLTKAFTGILAGMAVDSGRLTWDTRLDWILPNLRLHDPYASANVTLRDALSHRTGVARADFSWVLNPTLSQDSMIARMRYVQQERPFRSGYLYNNYMFLLAGRSVATVEQGSWDQLISRRLLVPLGMTRTNTSVKQLAGDPNVATPHTRVGDSVVVIPYHDIDNVAPAGAINSSASDMAKWIRFQLDSGRVAGRRLISAASFRETHRPQTLVPIDSVARARNPHTHLRAYAFGWSVADYHDQERLLHTGGLPGMASYVTLLPEKRIGVVVLSNLDDQTFPTALGFWVQGRLLGLPFNDQNPALLGDAERDRKEARAKDSVLAANRVPDTRPSLSLAQYAGTYFDSLYGMATVVDSGGTLILRLGSDYSSTFVHWHFDTFRGTPNKRGWAPTLWTFTLGPDGKVAALTGELFPGMPETERPIYRPVATRTVP